VTAAATGGEKRPADRAEPAPGGWRDRIDVAANLAHVYTECARIWNPIHTDRAVAVRAGLPDIILHGTATLALAVGRVLERDGCSPSAVARVTCRFGGMVRMPSALSLEVSAGQPRAFQVLADDGRPAVRDGRLQLRA
jgi:acyl dehydratase